MDYNDNVYEIQNHELAGEESSKISSVLRPFALPKFDFDYSLQGHLRFDSLVENEVFLGIPSQEDNRWIEDFSRGGSGIEFSSSAAESCALPRHINVWSEATSSESVEMLLKAVGQEEMVPGEKLEESEPCGQLDSSMRQIENVGQDHQNGDVIDYGNSLFPPAEVEGHFLRSNPSAGVKGVQTEYTVRAAETIVSSYVVCDDSNNGILTVNTEELNIKLKRTNNQEETRGLVNESLPTHSQESIPVLRTEIGIDKTESSSQNVAVSVKEPIDPDKISDISFESSSCVTKTISHSVEEHEEECNKDEVRLGGNAMETDSTERHCSHEVPSEMESSKEEHSLEMCIANFGEASSVARKGEPVSTEDGCSEVEFVVDPAGGSQHRTVVFSSSTEIKKNPEACSIFHDESFISMKRQGIEGVGVQDRDAVNSTICSEIELRQVPDIQTSSQNKSPVGNKYIPPGRHSCLEVPYVTLEVIGNPSDKVGESNHADGLDNTIGDRFCGKESVIDVMSDAGDTAAVQKENVENVDHAVPSLLVGSVQTSTEDIISMQLDSREDDLDVPVYGRDIRKLPLDSSDVVLYGNEMEVSTSSGDRVKVDPAAESQPNSSVSAYPALNTEVEGTKLASSCGEGDELVESNDHNIPSCDAAFRDHNKETESEALKQPCTSVSNEPLLSNERSPDLKTEKGALLDSEAGEIQKSTQSVLLVEPSNVSTPGHTELCEKMENSSNDLTVQDDGAAAPTEMQMIAESGTDSEANSFTVPVTSCTIEMDKSNQVAPPDISCTDLPQSVTYKQASLERGDIENTAKVFTTSEISGIIVSSEKEGTFTLDIRPSGCHSTRISGKGLQSFPIIQACKLSLTGEGFLSTSGSSLTDPVMVKEVSHVSSLTSPSDGVIGPSERKARRTSSKSGEASANKGSQVKEKTHFRQAEKWEKSSQFLSPLGAGQLVSFESSVKPMRPVSTPTSSLPDLNTSASSSAFFQQPFTDLQQVQLRAQIFIYGSLIQGAVPDEACMMSAFDGGRSFWEPSWRACVERLHGQKSHRKNTETPVSLRSGTKASDDTNRKGFPQIEAFTSMSGQPSKKPIPSPCVNPMTSLSSPLWNISTPSAEGLPPSCTARSAVIDYQAVSPLNPYETPPIRNYAAHTTWSSQAPFPVPWLASSQTSAYDIITTIPAFPNTAGHVKLNPSKESSPAVTSKHASPISTTHTGGSTMFAGVSSLDLKKLKVSSGQVADTKTRKRKKSLDAEDAVQISVTSSLADNVSDPVVPSQLSNKGPAVESLRQFSLGARNQGTSVAVATPSSFLQTGTTNQFFSMVSPLVSTDQFRRGDLSIDKRALNIECFSQVEEAKFQAQEAAAHAAAAIRQCQGVWSQLAQQKNTGLTTDVQSKLASAAVAVAAAVSVAKAASAAAKIASTAALQAKQMADEAVTKSGTVNPTKHDAILVSNSMNMVNESPVSILRGGDRQSVHSLAISAAREAARKKVEAASAATRHAENLDAIVKAAELAAEAVSHAGKIVSMAEPFSLSELVEAGPKNYWKVLQVGTVTDLNSNDKNKSKSISISAGEVPEAYMNQHEEPDKDMYVTSDVASPIQELSRNMVDDVAVEENIIAFGKHGENFEPQKDKKESDSANPLAVSHPDIESRSISYALSSIKEGSYVEVLKDRGDLKKAWFSASVLNLKDGEALVSYTELQSDEGSEQLKEWISIEVKDGEAPKVRTPHPMTAVQFEGTRKRRRAVVKDYTWSVGDKVDAWVQDCWREGVIAEKIQKQATTLIVNFPEQEEMLLVKVWYLRPTLIWRDGQWTEWCRPEQDPASEGDTPLEKRAKVGHSSICIEAKGKAKLAQNTDFVEIGGNQVPRLPLCATEKVFNIGSTREEKKPNMVSSGAMKKEGPRVVFGVPKPGKKRKFMEVSKHYVSDRVANDPVKLARFLAPQGSGSRGFKINNPKPDLKDKQVSESRPRAIKSEKPPSIPCRTLSRKDDSTSSRPNARNAAVSDIGKGSISYDENESVEQNIAEFGSSSNAEETSGGTMVFSSQALPRDNRKKTATKNIKSGRLNQGKLAPVSGRSSKKEANEKSTSEVSEPRRSNRRIQPTSRLLEGLQSSLLISKIPSHEKSHTSNLNKGATRGSNNRG